MARAYSQPCTDPIPLRMSYAEWQEWYGMDDLHRGEWVDGEVIPFMPPLVKHADLVDFLFFLIGTYVRRRRLGRVYSESVELWLPMSRAARLPDILYIADRHLDRLTAHRLDGYADLIIEVVSKESATRDQRVKFAEYRAAGVPEYWIVDPRPRRQLVDFYVLNAQGRYVEISPDRAGRLHSRVLPDFWLDPAWLWQEPRPGPLQVMAKIIAEQPEPLP